MNNKDELIVILGTLNSSVKSVVSGPESCVINCKAKQKDVCFFAWEKKFGSADLLFLFYWYSVNQLKLGTLWCIREWKKSIRVGKNRLEK